METGTISGYISEDIEYCPYCGARYELYDTPESEKKNYPYWRV